MHKKRKPLSRQLQLPLEFPYRERGPHRYVKGLGPFLWKAIVGHLEGRAVVTSHLTSHAPTAREARKIVREKIKRDFHGRKRGVHIYMEGYFYEVIHRMERLRESGGQTIS